MKTFILFYYPSNVFWLSAILPLLSLSAKYFSSLFLHGIASQLIPSIPHLYQERYNRSLSTFFSASAFVSIFLVIMSIKNFANKIPKDKLNGNFNLHLTLIIAFGIIMNFSFLLFNFLDINKLPFLTSLNLSFFYISASIFHISIGKIPGRFIYVDDFSRVFNNLILITSIIAVLTFNINCLTHKIDFLYCISSISQYVAFIACFLKFIIIGTKFNGDLFLSFYVEKNKANKSQWMNKVEPCQMLP